MADPRRPDGQVVGTSKCQGGAVQVERVNAPDILITTKTAGDAKQAASAEHRMSLIDGLKSYPAAAAWSILISSTIIMVAYDTVLLNSFFAYPSFRKNYGVPSKKGYQIPAAWQSGLSDGSNIGGIMGLVLNGFMVDKFGHKLVGLAALAVLMGLIFILFFAPNLPVLVVGEILCGIPFGMFQGLTTAYASEVAPVVLRPYLTSYINICWVFGHFLGSGILRALLNRTDKWGYKIPFAVQWIWPVPLFIGICFAPNSPWFLIRKGRLEEAEHSLRRLNQKATDAEIKDGLAMMVRTNEMEKDIQSGTTYLDCFRGVDLRRTEISVMAYLIQYLSGNGLSGYSTYFFEQAGFSPANAFDMTMAQYAIGFFGTILSWVLMSRFGRRTLYLVGLFLSTTLLYIVGFLALAPRDDSSANWATGSLLLIYFCVHSTFIGPLLYAIVGEMPSTRLRQKTIAIAAASWSIMGLINAALTPYMLNPNSWDWRGKAGFFWGGFCFISTVWAFFRLPEGKGKTYAELDVLFEKKISARKFKTYVVDPFDATDDTWDVPK
ncbi:hypothetical protein M433DRAFT_22903 [Acidomyces richmondensis BFW]|nr:MAG: hypothetical protein FE78DRAFT_141250 [Acidomyces sp. 'richmondensis']KYG47523.1 hypothetical protein M433DRAFT_22903 [Acidomyces richmondensis BFW]